MHPVRSTAPMLRLALALVFGFMSLGHGPVMTLAAAGHADHAMHRHASPAPGHSVHDHSAPGSSDASALPQSQPPCQGFGCFLGVSPAFAVPAAFPVFLSMLSPGLSDRIAPAPPEPADRPPRLQS